MHPWFCCLLAFAQIRYKAGISYSCEFVLQYVGMPLTEVLPETTIATLQLPSRLVSAFAEGLKVAFHSAFGVGDDLPFMRGFCARVEIPKPYLTAKRQFCCQCVSRAMIVSFL